MSQPVTLTLDGLARTAGTTGRNVRALQSKGLLPGPTLVGRTGEYGKAHVLRLRAVLGLQARGFGLRAIRELLLAWGPLDAWAQRWVKALGRSGPPQGRRKP